MKSYLNLKLNKLIGAVIIVTGFLLAQPALAVDVFFQSTALEPQINQQLKVNLLIEVGENDINALEAAINFPLDKLQLVDIIDSRSIINLWLDKPQVQDGQIYFSGIIPGGFQGMLRPYYQEPEPGNILSLIFLAKADGEAILNLEQVRVLLNNGLGTAAVVNQTDLIINISSEEAPETIFVERELDYEIPEKFFPEIQRDPNLFNNQWLVVFYAQDKNSGIAAYYVYESPKFIVPSQITTTAWQSATSPHLLQDQTLQSYVYIKAVDKAGNERVEVINPAVNPSPWYQNYQNLVIIIISCLIFLLIASYLWKKVSRTQ